MERLHLIKDRLFGENISMAFSYMKECFPKLLGLILLLVPFAFIEGVFILPAFLNGFINSYNSSFLLSTVLVFMLKEIIHVFITVFVVSMGTLYVSGSHISFGAIGKKALPLFFWAILGAFGYNLSVGVGALLLIVPGIYLAISFYMYLFSMSYYNLGPLDGLSKSMQLVSGHWWITFGYLSFVFLLQFLLGGLPGAIIKELGYAFISDNVVSCYLLYVLFIFISMIGICVTTMFVTVYFFNLVDKYEGVYEDTRITSIGEENKEEEIF